MTNASSELSPRQRGMLLVVVVALLLAAGGWWLRAALRPAPPMPDDVKDAEVRSALATSRQSVLEQADARAWGRYGMVLLAHLFDQEAKVCFAEAARLDPADPLWPYAMGLIAEKREPERAVPLFEQAAAAAQHTPELRAAIRLQLGEVLLENNRLDEAQTIFEEEQRLAPRDPRSALGLGLVALARGNLAEAEPNLKIARNSSFARKKATGQLAALARQRGDAQESQAREAEAAALAEDPPWPDPLLDEIVTLQVGRRGRQRRTALLENEGRFAEAAQIFLRQIEADPTIDDYIGAGLNLGRLRDYDRALPLLRKAVELDPEHVQAQYTLALAVFSRAERQPNAALAAEDFRAAALHAQRAADRKPDHAQALLYLGLSRKHLGDHAGAVLPLQKGIEVQPPSTKLQFELHFGLAEVLAELGRAKEAETHLENARRLNSADPRLAGLTDRLRAKK